MINQECHEKVQILGKRYIKCNLLNLSKLGNNPQKLNKVEHVLPEWIQFMKEINS